jgi:hypothetical protein
VRKWSAKYSDCSQDQQFEFSLKEDIRDDCEIKFNPKCPYYKGTQIYIDKPLY